MSGAGRTGKFLGGDHWNCRPDIVALSKGIGSGYVPLGALAAPERIVEPVLDIGRLPAWPHLCRQSAGLRRRAWRCCGEMDRLDLIDNAAAMGERADGRAARPGEALPVHRRRARQGPADGVEMVADPATHAAAAAALESAPAHPRPRLRARPDHLFAAASRAASQGDNFMVCAAADRHARADRRDHRPSSATSLDGSGRASSTCRSKAEALESMAPRKVIITCAVTGSVHTPSMSPLSAGDARPDRDRGDRRGRSRRVDPASACPRSRGRPADRRSRRVHAVPAAHQAGDAMR